jgi:GDP-4-dehydro-6-deoxy-D-mannose reductase
MTPERHGTLVITGAAGFVGSHLLAHLAAAPDAPSRVVGADLRAGAPGAAEWVSCDLASASEAAALVKRFAPHTIIHLAGLAAGDDLHACFAANVQAAANLLAAAAAADQAARVVIVGSAAQYGVTTGDHEVVDEGRPLLGRTPYAVTKTLQERWALAYADSGALEVVCVRPFNLMGPGQPPRLVPAAFLHQVAEVVDGKRAEVCVGNTATSRDFTDVRDAVAALWALATTPARVTGEVFNLASGQAVRIADLLEACLALAGRPVPVRRDPARLRSEDVPTIVGDAGKLRRATGWQPHISWQQSLQDMWNVFRQRGG